MCQKKPELKEEVPTKEWDEHKSEVTEQEATIHMIKIGPVTERFLSKKKLNPALDFLQGVKFTLTEDSDYLWTSGDDLKGLPVHSQYQLLDALTRMGYKDPCGGNRVGYPTHESSDDPVKKFVYIFEESQ